MATIRKWTGRESRALREAMRLSQREFASKLGVTGRAVSKWEAGRVKTLRSDSQEILDTKLRMVSDEVRARFELILAGETEAEETKQDITVSARDLSGEERLCDGCGLPLSRYNPGDLCQSCISAGRKDQPVESGKVPINGSKSNENLLKHVTERPAEVVNSQFGVSFNPADMVDRISELANWAETTNIGDGTLAYLDSAALQLAHDCLTVPPLQTRERADALIKRIYEILRSGHQRLGQTRELYIIAGKLCAILSWVSGDLGQLAVADAHARNGWTLADQADHDGLRALLLSARSKIDFWRRRYGDAAKHARRGYEYDPPGTLRVLLACQEADALQAMGRIEDAIEALARSELTQNAIRTQENVSESEELGGIFGCGIARQSNYSIGTYLRSGSTDQALLHVRRAETAWENGDEWAYGTWAQVQIGAAIAHLMNGEIDGAAMILRRILDQPTETRLATLATRLNREVSPLLSGTAMGQSKLAIALREGIADYDQSPIRQVTVGGES